MWSERKHERVNGDELSCNSVQHFHQNSSSERLQSQTANECLHPIARSDRLTLSTTSARECVYRRHCWLHKHFLRLYHLCPTLRDTAGHSHTHTTDSKVRCLSNCLTIVVSPNCFKPASTCLYDHLTTPPSPFRRLCAPSTHSCKRSLLQCPHIGLGVTIHIIGVALTDSPIVSLAIQHE